MTGVTRCNLHNSSIARVIVWDLMFGFCGGLTFHFSEKISNQEITKDEMIQSLLEIWIISIKGYQIQI